MCDRDSEFESEIRVEINNISLIFDQKRKYSHLEMLWVRLLPIISSKDLKTAENFENRIYTINKLNMEITDIHINGSFGFKIEDTISGVNIKVKYDDFLKKGLNQFENLRYEYINKKLKDILCEILDWFYKTGIFVHNNCGLLE